MDLDKIFMFKGDRDLKEVNDIFIVIKELEEYYIVKRCDTITDEEKIEALSKDYVVSNLYTVQEFLDNSVYVGKTGFYKNNNFLEKYLRDTIMLVYKDEHNDLLYDIIMEKFFVAPSIYPLEDFVESKNQNEKIRFKKGLGKK